MIKKALATFVLGVCLLFGAGTVSASEILKQGDRSEDVVELQEVLAEKGLYDYKIDGIYGSITVNGVEALQQINDFQVDGVVGPETASAIPTISFEVSFQPSKETNNEVVSYANSNAMTMEATYYTARCTGCMGITREGTDVRNSIYHPSGYRIAAVDPNVIPLGTLIEINGETFIADDTGGHIKGNRVDILVDSKAEAREKGRHNVEVTTK